MQGAPAFVRTLGRLARSVGQGLDRFGLSLQDHVQPDRLVPSARVVAVKGKELQHGLQNFVASSASVVGDVAIGELSSVWYGAVVRGDKGSVRIGRNVAVLDNAIVSGGGAGKSATLGSDVVVAPGAVVRGATIGDGAMIGMGAQVQPGASVGADSFVDAGAVVTAGTVVPPGQLWTGAPARHLRNLSPDEMSYLRSSAVTYGTLSQAHYEQGAKTTAEVEYDDKLRWLKLESGFAPDAPVVAPDADVVRYYELTAGRSDAGGLFRSTEVDMKAEAAAREAEEIAHDRAEEAHYAQIAQRKRVGEAMRLLAATPPARGPAAREKVVADLAARDPAGVDMLLGLVAQVEAVAPTPAGSAERTEVLRAIVALAPEQFTSEDEARNAAAGVFDALLAHAKAGLVAGSSGSGMPSLAAGAGAAAGSGAAAARA